MTSASPTGTTSFLPTEGCCSCIVQSDCSGEGAGGPWTRSQRGSIGVHGNGHLQTAWPSRPCGPLLSLHFSLQLLLLSGCSWLVVLLVQWLGQQPHHSIESSCCFRCVTACGDDSTSSIVSAVAVFNVKLSHMQAILISPTTSPVCASGPKITSRLQPNCVTSTANVTKKGVVVRGVGVTQ